jgi:hypothetical protein
MTQILMPALSPTRFTAVMARLDRATQQARVRARKVPFPAADAAVLGGPLKAGHDKAGVR